MTPEQKLKQLFDEAIYQKYCHTVLFIPPECLECYREKITNTFGYQRFALARAYEVLAGEIKKSIKDLLLGRFRKE